MRDRHPHLPLMDIISKDLLNSLFELSSQSPSGLIWKVNLGGKAFIGNIAGGISVRKNSKYYIVGYDYSVYYVHKIVYSIYNNVEYSNKIKIDHIDGNQLNNSPTNLRIVNSSQNSMNSRKISKTTTSKYKGVYYSTKRKRWIARIKRNGVTKHIGSFMLEIDAANAYNSEALLLFGDYARVNEL